MFSDNITAFASYAQLSNKAEAAGIQESLPP